MRTHLAPRATATSLFVLCTACALASLAVAQEIEKIPPPKPGEERRGDAPGPAATRMGRFLIGDEAPDIDLNDERGLRFRLSEARKARPYLIAFARLPEEVLEVERARADLDSAGISVIVVAPFHRERVVELMGEPRVRFLQDRASRAARVYGLFDAVTSNPRPGAILVDKRQRIRLIIAGIMPSGDELARSAIEAMEPPVKSAESVKR
jgi:hypothetical protein